MSNLIDNLNRIAKDHETLRQADPKSSNQNIRGLLNAVQDEITQKLDLEFGHIRVHYSLGSSMLPKTPVIYLFDKRETNTGNKGVYLALIFSCDSQMPDYGTYTLTLTQGIQDAKAKHGDLYKQVLSEKALGLSARYAEQASATLIGFDSRADNKLKEQIRVFEKSYDTSESLTERQLFSDINGLLRIYNRYVDDIDNDEVWDELLAISEDSDLDIEVTSKQRKEQRLLRKYLSRDKPKQQCAVCKNVYPMDFLVAAHIKKRSHCSKVEKLDFSNVANRE